MAARRRFAGLILALAGCQGSAPLIPPADDTPLTSTTSVTRSQMPAAPVVPLGAGPAAPVATAGRVEGTQPAVDTRGAETQIRVIAVIGPDQVITDDEVYMLVRQRAQEYVTLTGSERAAKEKDIFQDCLRSLIDRELVLADFLGKLKKNKPQAIRELEEEAAKMVDAELVPYRNANKVKTNAELEALMARQGVSMKAFRRDRERRAMMNIYLGQVLREKAKQVTLPNLMDYYAKHPDEFTTPDKVVWQDLFVSLQRYNGSVADAQAAAVALQRQAAAGADFAALVKAHGHGDSPLRGGAGIGTTPADIRPAELAGNVLALAAGQVSGVIPTETGFHIVKVVEREKAGVKPFDDKVQQQIRQKETARLQKLEYDRIIEELWRKTTVRVVEEAMPK